MAGRRSRDLLAGTHEAQAFGLAACWCRVCRVFWQFGARAGTGGNAPAPENEQLPPVLQPTIASSIPVLAQFKKGLLDLGYNLRLIILRMAWAIPLAASSRAPLMKAFFTWCSTRTSPRLLGWTASVFASTLIRSTGVSCRRPTSSTLRELTASRRGQRPGCSSFGSNRSSAIWRRSALVN